MSCNEEDDLAISGFLQMSLEDCGYTVQADSDGKAALRHIQQTRPALIVLDIQLPSLTGDEILKHMRANETLRAIPVVVISAFQALPESVHTDAQAVLKKPFNLAQLLDLIARWLPLPGG
jgi:two-component system cell cycle response regulator DivK